MEIWGTGGDEFICKGMQSQMSSRTIQEENIQKARKVDKAQLANNSFDQEFLMPKTFSHRVRVETDAT